ncbi:MAG: lamin tail domain-containing protein [Planctomycetota bacterium]
MRNLRAFAYAGLAAASVAGLASAQGPVINEVSYDAVGGDDGNVFVEIFGRPGFDLSGYTIQGIEGSGGSASGCNNESFTFPAGALIPADGFVVVADADSSGSTLVPNFDYLDSDMDLENSNEAVQLLDPGGAIVDAVGYGAIDTTIIASVCNGETWFEGMPARDVFAPLSLERCPAGNDTDDNSADFIPNVPTPGSGEACCSAIEWVDQGSFDDISVSGGESVGFDFWFSRCGAGQPYIVLWSCTDPAISPGPLGLPVFDACTAPVIPFAGIPPFVGWTGILDASGASIGTAALDFSGLGLPPLAGNLDVWVGAATFNPFTPPPYLGTNSVQITLEP